MKLIYYIILRITLALTLILTVWAVFFYVTTVSYTHLTLPTTLTV